MPLAVNHLLRQIRPKQLRQVEVISSSSKKPPATTARDTPQQTLMRTQIADFDIEISALQQKQINSEHDLIRLKDLKKQREGALKKLRLLKNQQINSQNFCDKKKSSKPKPRGRPQIEEAEGCAHLADAILACVSGGSSAESLRRSEILTGCRTLNELKQVLSDKFQIDIARSTLYSRLQPKRQNSHEGARHLNTVPVALRRPQNDLMNQHPDGHFATSLIKYMKDLAVLYGPKYAVYLSQDDKARVPLGLAAAKIQSSVLMHLEYRVKLPDHDFPVANRHKLIPSVYAFCKIEDDAVKSAGNTYIFIRSGKHDSSTAASHRADFMDIYNRDDSPLRGTDGKALPILTVTVDGGPDENPRYQQNVHSWATVFKALDLDLLIVACHAPGQSAFNFVERRMAPLSKLMAGVILPYTTFGNHLDASRNTKDSALEKQNFGAAGKILGELWSAGIIDGFPISANYVDPDKELPPSDEIIQTWFDDHIVHSYYAIQISKCADSSCCGERRAPMICRFIPPPVPFRGLDVDTQGHFGSLSERMAKNFVVPRNTVMDSFCPSSSSALKQRTCGCGRYYPTKKELALHFKNGCTRRPPTFDDDDDFSIPQAVTPSVDNLQFPVYEPSDFYV